VRRSSEAFAAVSHAEVAVVGVDRWGRVDPDEVMAATSPGSGLVHVQWGNHEVGTTQPVDEIVRRCRAAGVLVHVDAAQAAGRVPIAFDQLGADLLSVSGPKFGAPPGTGALLVPRRAGLENVPALMGLGAAAGVLAGDERLAAEQADGRRLTDRVLDLASGLVGVRVYGDPRGRLPHLVCLGIDGIEPQAVLLELDRAGIAAHSGSACASEGVEDSPVLAAMGADAHRSLRISVGWSTTDADIDALVEVLPAVLERLRALGT
jgi:cysteine desulfurase